MTRATPSAGRTWPEAAREFARRATRRRRAGALLGPFAIGLFAGALAALTLAFAARGGWALPWAWLALGAGLGLAAGVFRARAVKAVTDGDAAWALDRIAGVSERGLTAATVVGPRGAEAAFARPMLAPPPSVRLLPAPGLAVFVGALLFAFVAAVVGHSRGASEADARRDATDEAAMTASTDGAGDGATSTGAPGSDDLVRRAENAARAAEAEAAAANRVLRALGLPDDEPLDPAEIADRLADPKQRETAANAAGDGLGEEFRAPGTSPESMARRVSRAAEGRHRAQSARRRAAGARARSTRPALPPGRRDLVDRYLDRVRSAPPTTGRRDATGPEERGPR